MSLLDILDRDHTIYGVCFLLAAALYFLVTVTQKLHSVTLCVLVTTAIISMYGGGFSTIPAYLRDLFGTVHRGAIHGPVWEKRPTGRSTPRSIAE